MSGSRPWRVDGAPGACPPPALFALGLCLLALLAAARVATDVFDRVPHLEDEVAYLFQARTIAAGRLVAPAPARPEFFEMPFVVVRDGQWFGKYPPGYPAVLALGVLAGQPWLVNPLLGALAVGLVYLLGRRLYGAPTGLLAAVLAVASPFFLLQAGSSMSHVACLVWALAFLLLFERARQGSPAAALLAGGALGALFLSRPLTAVGVGLPCALWAALDILQARRRLPDYLPTLLGLLPFVASLLAYNLQTTGDPLRSAYELWWSFDRWGFGEGIGPGGGHTLEQGLANARFNLVRLADYLFGWPAHLSLAPAALATAVALGRLQRRGRRRPAGPGAEEPAATPPEAWDLLHVGALASLVALHVGYWMGDVSYGPRYYFEALGGLVLLSARGLLHGARLAATLLGWAAPSLPRPRVWTTAATLLAVAGLSLHALGEFVPREFGRYVRWYGIDRSGVRQVQAAGLDHAVVFVRRQSWTDYAPFFAQNAPSLDSPVVYAIDLGDARNRDLMALYPGRGYFRYADGTLAPLSPP